MEKMLMKQIIQNGLISAFFKYNFVFFDTNRQGRKCASVFE